MNKFLIKINCTVIFIIYQISLFVAQTPCGALSISNNNLTLDAILPGLYQGTTIDSDGFVDTATTVHMKAEVSIDLNAPFEVALGAEYEAWIDNCHWVPPPGTTWQWQLSGTLDTTFDVEVYDIDGFDNSAAAVTGLHNDGRKVICYISAGTWEEWRPDADDFPGAVLGNDVDGWEGEKWLDIRNLSVLGPLMEARMDMCLAKGFDAVEPDNIDGYINGSGFPLTAEDQLAYNLFLANAAHNRGLSIGLKNDVDQAEELEPWFDFAINEECFTYNECNSLLPFINAGKAVFSVEYPPYPSNFCVDANALNFSAMKKLLDLDAWMEPCW